jgi:hypothetical protein
VGISWEFRGNFVGISWEIVCLIFNELRLFLGSSWEFGGNFVGIWWEFGGKLFEELVGLKKKRTRRNALL